MSLSLLMVSLSLNAPSHAGSPIAVGPQYDSTHVYVAPTDLDAFVAAFNATFGARPPRRAP